MRWAVALVLAAAAAQAAPAVEILARTQLSIGRVKARDDGLVEVNGRLTDKLTGVGLGGQHVSVKLGELSRIATTDDGGLFQLYMRADPGPLQITLGYEGNTRLEQAAPVTVTTDPTKSHLELAIVKISDDPAGARLRVNAAGDDGPVVVAVKLEVATLGSGEFRPVRTVETGSELVLKRSDTGGAGIHRLRASFAGDTANQPASTIVTIELSSETHTTIAVANTKLAFEDELVVTGRVNDDDEQPVSSAAVTLMSGDRRLAQAGTDRAGRFRFEVDGEVIGAGQFGIQVQSDPGKPYVKPSRSQPEIVRIAAPQPVPVSYTIAAFIATVLAAGGFFAARSKPWRRLRRPASPAELPREPGDIPAQHGGLVVAKPSIVSTLRRPYDDGIAGVVRDTVRGRPVADATVRVAIEGSERSVRTGADGSFAIETLDAGDWRAEVVAAGHVTERFAVTIPHRGELRGVRVDLVPVRERVFQLYRHAAEPVLPEPRLWGIWSPRQIFEHVRAKRPSPALADLTDFVEEVYFSPRQTAETVLPQAAERVDRAVHERARPRRD